jgi:hypothetical protein
MPDPVRLRTKKVHFSSPISDWAPQGLGPWLLDIAAGRAFREASAWNGKAVAIYPACKLLGVVGGQVAVLFAIIVSYLLQAIRLRELTGLDLLCYARTLVLPTLGSVGMLGVVVVGRRLGLGTRHTSDLALCVGSCLVAYILYALARLRAAQRRVTVHSAPPPESVAAV